jgi:YHS domain-containing protein
MLLRLLLWVILIAFLARALSRFVRGVLEGAGYSRDQRAVRAAALVKDPVCGIYVVPAQALALGHGRDTRYFCSEKCRQAWRAR